jgi:hypothetical protein
MVSDSFGEVRRPEIDRTNHLGRSPYPHQEMPFPGICHPPLGDFNMLEG